RGGQDGHGDPRRPAGADDHVGRPAAGQPYTHTVTAEGFPAPTLAVSGGSLPEGLTFDTATGTISGTPTQAGQVAVTFGAHTAAGDDLATYLLVVDPEVTVRLDAAAVVSGEELEVTGTGFWPGETVALELWSTPVPLGTVVAG